jgi:putative hydrolase of the HAD superfamily
VTRRASSKPFRVRVGFDADDTLWHCERDFADIQRRFAELLAPWAAVDASIGEHLDAVERRNLEVFGYGVKGFMLSMIESAIMLTDGGVTADEIQRIIDWGKDLLGAGGRGLETLDGVAGVLDALEDRELVLITKGDLFEQETKVAASGLADHFSAVEVVAEKSATSFCRVLERHSIDPAEFVFIGNSVKSDILPVLELGGYAVHVPYPLVWAHEEAPLPADHDRLFQAGSIAEVPGIIASIEAGGA